MEHESTRAPRVRALEASVLVLWHGGASNHPLEKGKRVTVGRASSCDISVPDESISRVHLAIDVDAETTVTDLGSSHGTRVDGVRIQPSVPVKVTSSSVIEIGDATVIVRAPPPPELEPSAPHHQLDALLNLVAASDINVVLLGETGVGKGVAAERIHRASRRASGPFLPLSCASLPETLLEGELFGHERGAFTGALSSRAGLFESANGGTLFLDEIGELPLTTQVKLLRVVENREVIRLGDRRPRTIDVRLVAATHRDLETLVAEGRFREDLYFRLNGISIEIPPLRARTGEILPLALRFLGEACAKAGRPPLGLAISAREALLAHAWPGNVRELRNVIDRAVVLARGTEVVAESLSFGGRISIAPPAAPARAAVTTLEGAVAAAEEQKIREALEKAGHNQTRAAELLGISRRTLLRRLDEYRLARPRKGDQGDG